MIKIYLNRIMDSYSLQKEDIDIKEIRNLALKKGANMEERIIRRKLSTSSADFLNRKANEIIHVNQIKLESNLEKQLFKTSFVFYDNERFLNNLENYGISFDSLRKTYDTLVASKLAGKESVTIRSSRIEKLKNYYGINEVETIINKIGELAYLEPELVEENQKVKKLA